MTSSTYTAKAMRASVEAPARRSASVLSAVMMGLRERARHERAEHHADEGSGEAEERRWHGGLRGGESGDEPGDEACGRGDDGAGVVRAPPEDARGERHERCDESHRVRILHHVVHRLLLVERE